MGLCLNSLPVFSIKLLELKILLINMLFVIFVISFRNNCLRQLRIIGAAIGCLNRVSGVSFVVNDLLIRRWAFRQARKICHQLRF